MTLYEEFFGFKTKPFRKTPDPAFLYRSRAHEEALARMEQVVEDKDTMVLIGDIGAGKTTLSRVLIDSLKNVTPILIVNPVLTPTQFLRTVAIRLGAKKPATCKAELIDQVSDLIWKANENNAPPVMIIDEAHLIPGRDTIEEIRLLTNFQLDDSNLISVILLAQPEMEKRLKRKEYAAFRQRIGMQYKLGPLGAQDISKYIDHRVKTAGGKPEIFKKDAKDAIGGFSKGIPRKINNLASGSLLEAFARDTRTVTAEIVKNAAVDLGMAEENDLAA